MYRMLIVLALFLYGCGNNDDGGGGGGTAIYTISLSAVTTNPGVDDTSLMTATVMDNGTAVSGQNVVFTWTVKGGNLASQTGATVATDASGEAAWTLNGSGNRRTITVTATLQSDSSKTATAEVQFGDALPDGFIALSSTDLTWDDGVSYCTGQGGSLPAFGTYIYTGGTLPSGSYWSSDEIGSDDAYFLISDSHDRGQALKSHLYRVVCVP